MMTHVSVAIEVPERWLNAVHAAPHTRADKEHQSSCSVISPGRRLLNSTAKLAEDQHASPLSELWVK